jgi:dolichol-phosphate mannosyltransferase
MWHRYIVAAVIKFSAYYTLPLGIRHPIGVEYGWFSPLCQENRQVKDKISIIIPTYNEKGNIAPLLARIHQALSGHDYEVLLVDDESKDGTIEVALSLASRYPLKVIVRRKEKGLATAVVHGLKSASGQIIGVMDADLQHPPEVIPQMLKALNKGADMALASRYVEGGGCPHWGLSRRVISKVASALSHLLLPSTRQVKDPLSGFFIFRRQNIAQAKLKPIGYKISLEIMLAGRFRHVVEVPYIFEDRSAGKSKLNSRQQLDYLRHILSLMTRTGELKRFLKFCAVGVSGIIVNQGLLWLLTDLAGLRYYISALFGIEASIISNFVLNDYFTFADRRSGKGKSFLVRLLKFNVTCLAGAGIQYGLLLLFTSVFDIYYLISNLIAIAVAFLWNYLVGSWWTWK